MIFIYTLDPCLDKPSSGRCLREPYGSRCRDSQSDIMWRKRLIGGICQVLLIRESLAREAEKILGVRGDRNTRRTWPSESAKWDLHALPKPETESAGSAGVCTMSSAYILAASIKFSWDS